MYWVFRFLQSRTIPVEAIVTNVKFRYIEAKCANLTGYSLFLVNNIMRKVLERREQYGRILPF